MTTVEKILAGLLVGVILYVANEKGWIKLPGKKGGGGDGAAPGGWLELPGTDNAGASKGDPIGPGGAVPASRFPLRRGSKGPEVTALQKALGGGPQRHGANFRPADGSRFVQTIRL